MNSERPYSYRNRAGDDISLCAEPWNDQRNDLGGFHDKMLGKARVCCGEKVREISVFMKEGSIYNDDCFGEETLNMVEAERYFERWKYLRKIGIPTMSSMRYVGYGKVLMGDMTVDGSVFVGKAEAKIWWKEVKYRATRSLDNAEKSFLAIDPQELKNEISRIHKIAWDNGFELPSDDEEFTVLVCPDGHWKVLVMDLSCLWRRMNRNMNHFVDTEIILHKRVDQMRELLLRVAI